MTANNGIEPVDGGFVTFLAPGSGPTATLSATTATIAAGAASVTATADGTAGGPYTVTASAAGAGQVGFALTNLTLFVQPVFSNLAAPTITYGTSTATLSGTIAAGLSIPTGSVAITVGGVTAPATIEGDGSFSAVFDTHALVVAGSPYTVSYDFAASGNFLGSSGTSSLTITPASTTTILASSANPSILGQAVTYTATVTADAPSTGTPSGTVQFQVDGSDYGNPATLAENNTASLTLSTLAAGAHTIVAVYTPAGSNFLTSTSSVCTEQVNAVNSQNLANVIEQMMTANPGQPITIDIQTLDNTAAQGQVAAIDALGPQNTPITFQLGLSSSGNYQSLHASPPQNVTLVITGTLGQSGNTYTTIIVGHSPALTVGVAPDGTAGTVIAKDLLLTTATAGPTVLVTGGHLTLSNSLIEESTGYAEAAVSLAGGTLTLENTILDVNGLGEFVHNTTTSTVTMAGTTFAADGTAQTASALSFTTLTTSAPDSSVYGQNVTFTATVRPNLADSAPPTGAVNFYDGTTLIGSRELVGGVATFTTSALTAGNHPIMARYDGDGTFGCSLDNLSETVAKATPNITWANPGDITYGTALSGTQLNATSSWTVGGVLGSVAGTFTYTPAAGNVLGRPTISRCRLASPPPIRPTTTPPPSLSASTSTRRRQ